MLVRIQDLTVLMGMCCYMQRQTKTPKFPHQIEKGTELAINTAIVMNNHHKE